MVDQDERREEPPPPLGQDTLIMFPTLTMRRVRGLAYGLIMVCGLILPFQVLAEAQRPVTWVVTCTFLTLGALSCAVGQLSGKWVGEYVGLPFVFTALWCFGALQIAVSGWYALPSVSLLWGLVGILVARWRDTAAVFKATRGGERDRRH